MRNYLIAILILIFAQPLLAKDIYFPPLNNTLNWEKTSLEVLNWNVNKIDSLYDFLEHENSKAFIVLKDGKIVLEKYFGTFSADSLWYWASAGKTITSFLVGKAQQDNFLSISEPASKYLGVGWTSCSAEQENMISIRNQLTMTSGLDDGVSDNHCLTPECLVYKATPGTRWAYHNAPYTLLEKVIENATSTNINLYTHSKLKSKIGMNGAWVTIGSDNVYYSNARSMARFGLLMQNKCIWENDTLLRDTAYINAALNTSQQINKSYGYLWWLNGKGSYMLPTLQFVFQGNYAPDAPDDMYAALGKNGQIISISPSTGLVVIRMGNVPSSPAADIAPQLCNQIWRMLNEVTDNKTDMQQVDNPRSVKLLANTSNSTYTLNFENAIDRLAIFNTHGVLLEKKLFPKSPYTFDMSRFPIGVYILQTIAAGKMSYLYFIKR